VNPNPAVWKNLNEVKAWVMRQTDFFVTPRDDPASTFYWPQLRRTGVFRFRFGSLPSAKTLTVYRLGVCGEDLVVGEMSGSTFIPVVDVDTDEVRVLQRLNELVSPAAPDLTSPVWLLSLSTKREAVNLYEVWRTLLPADLRDTPFWEYCQMATSGPSPSFKQEIQGEFVTAEQADEVIRPRRVPYRKSRRSVNGTVREDERVKMRVQEMLASEVGRVELKDLLAECLRELSDKRRAGLLSDDDIPPFPLRPRRKLDF